MSEASVPGDVLKGWDPRRRAALEGIWDQFRQVGARGANLSEELIAERRREAAAGDQQP